MPDFWTTNLSEDPRYIRSSSYNELIITGIFPLLALCYYNYEIYARIRLSCFIELGRYVGGKYNSVDQFKTINQILLERETPIRNLRLPTKVII